MTTNQEKCYSLSFLIATPSSRTLDGLFELTQHPSRALNLALCIALEPRDSVWGGSPGTEVPEYS